MNSNDVLADFNGDEVTSSGKALPVSVGTSGARWIQDSSEDGLCSCASSEKEGAQ